MNSKSSRIEYLTQKTPEYLLYLFVFLLPWQTRWIARDYQIGETVFEYGRISLYAFDIILIVLLFHYFIVGKKQAIVSNGQRVTRNERVWLLFLSVYILVTTIFASEKLVSFYWVARLTLGGGLFWAIQKISFSRLKLAIVAVTAGFTQGLLAVWQFVGQSVWSNKWLGMAEQVASKSGASVVEVGSERWLRGYGSLPHPNILGAILAIIFLIWLYLLTQAKETQQKRFVWLTGVSMAMGIFFSFSRAAWLVFVIIYALGWFYNFKYKQEIFFKKSLVVIGLVILALAVFCSPLVLTRLGVGEQQRLEIKSSVERLNGYSQAVGLIKNNLWGVGIGNYAFAVRDLYNIERPWDIQPVHNIFVLVAVELGVAGLVIILLFHCFIASLLIKNKKWFMFGGLLIIYGLMLFDHFWWTTATGMYVLWLIWGVSYKEGKKEGL